MLTPKPLSGIGGRHSIHGSLELPFKSTAFENHTTTTRIRDISHSFIKRRRATTDSDAQSHHSAPTSSRNSPSGRRSPTGRRLTPGPGHHHEANKGKALKYLKKELVQWFSKEKALTPVTVSTASASAAAPMATRSSWKPSLSTIYGDSDLLDALIRFMTKQYNAENILFLRAAHRLNAMIEDTMTNSPMVPLNRFEEQKLDSAIVSVYRSFIAEDTAQQQINLKYAVKTRINEIFTAPNTTVAGPATVGATKISMIERLSRFTLRQKRHIFDECIGEIEQLVVCVFAICRYVST